MTDRKYVFVEMPVRKAVTTQCLPAVISQLIILLYNWADTFFVGQLNDSKLLAGTAIATPVILLLTAIGNLAGVGGSTMISSAMGRGDNQGAKRIAANTFWFGFLCSIIFSACYAIWGDKLLILAGATNITLGPSHEYTLWVVTIGSLVIIPNLVLANMIRAEGMAKHASAGISFGAILNVLLDLLLILPELGNLGIAGAGIATLVSNMLTTAYFLIVLWCKRQQTILTLSPSYLQNIRKTVREITHIGLSSSLQYMLTVLAVGAQAHFVSKYSAEAIAALGVVKRLDYLPLLFSIGMSQGMLPLLSFNHAAKNYTRQHEVFKFGTTVSVLFAVSCFVMYETFAPEIAGIFVKDTITRNYIAGFLRCMVVAMPFMAFCYPMITQFQATKCLKAALACTIVRKGIIDIPLLILFDKLLPLYGCMWVQPTVDIMAMLLALLLYRRTKILY